MDHHHPHQIHSEYSSSSLRYLDAGAASLPIHVDGCCRLKPVPCSSVLLDARRGKRALDKNGLDDMDDSSTGCSSDQSDEDLHVNAEVDAFCQQLEHQYNELASQRAIHLVQNMKVTVRDQIEKVAANRPNYPSVDIGETRDLGTTSSTSRFRWSDKEVVLPVRTVKYVEPIPRIASYTSLKSSMRNEDDVRLRYIPYFGEHDELHVDHNVFSSEHDCESDMLEIDDYILLLVCKRFGASPAVFNALENCLGINVTTFRNRYERLSGIAQQKQKVLEHIKDNEDAQDSLLDSFETLFCRFCYTYNCNEHPTGQPRAHGRKLPVHSVLNANKRRYVERYYQYQSSWASRKYIAPPILPLDQSQPCGDECFFAPIDYDRDRCRADAQCWNATEIATFLKCVLVCQSIMCDVAVLMGKPCRVVREAARLHNIFDSREPHGQAICDKRSDDVHKSKAQSTIFRLKSGAVHAYVPCDHPGPCIDPATCTCIQNNTRCDKMCGCNIRCRRRFQGCRCTSGCKTRQCPCLAGLRECDPDLCRCSCADEVNSNCCNMQMRQRKYKPIRLGRSSTHGFGVFSMSDIAKGELVAEYVGERISHEEADRRGLVYDKMSLSYLFQVNEEQVLDAARFGNKTKFSNHSQRPNCYSQVVMVNGEHRVGIYSEVDIKAGQELFFNYNHRRTGDSVLVPEWFKKA